MEQCAWASVPPPADLSHRFRPNEATSFEMLLEQGGFQLWITRTETQLCFHIAYGGTLLCRDMTRAKDALKLFSHLAQQAD